MIEVIKLVQGDTYPALLVTLTDSNNQDQPIDLTGATVNLYFREMGSSTIKDTLVGLVLAPLDGLCRFNWGLTTLDTAGDFEGEIEITYGPNKIQTTYGLLYFTVREQF